MTAWPFTVASASILVHTALIMPTSAIIQQPAVSEIVIDFAVPPSLNRLWRYGRKRVYKNPVVNFWTWGFFYAWRGKYGVQQPIKGPIDVEILICPKRKRDADNSAKALLDACQRVGIIKNDSQVRKVTQEVVEPERAPMGCRLRIIPI